MAKAPPSRGGVPAGYCNICHHTVGVHDVGGCTFECGCMARRSGQDTLALPLNWETEEMPGECGHAEGAVCDNSHAEGQLRRCTECDHRVDKHTPLGCGQCRAEKLPTERCGINIHQFSMMLSLSRPGPQVPWVEQSRPVQSASCANPDRIQVTMNNKDAVFTPAGCPAEYHGASGDYRCTYSEHPKGLVHRAPDRDNPELTFHWDEKVAVYPLPGPPPGPIRSSGGPSVRDRQVGGSHYLGAIQPWDIWEAFELNPWQANAIKYILRAGNKPGVTAREDFSKAIHFLEYLVEREDRDE